MLSCTGNSHLLPPVISLTSLQILHLLWLQCWGLTLQHLNFQVLVSDECMFPWHSDFLKQTNMSLVEGSSSFLKERYP